MGLGQRPPDISVQAGQGDLPGLVLAAWWRLIDFKIGVVPVPVFLLLLVVIAASVASGKTPADIPFNIALLSVGGFTCADGRNTR